MIKAVVFDFFGVVCNEIGSPWYKQIPSEETINVLHEKYDKPSNLGLISEEDFFDGIAQSVGKKGSEVRRDWMNSAKTDDAIVDLIKEFKSDYKVALCSNTQSHLLRDLLRDNKLEELFDVVVSSSEVGKIKPNQDIFDDVVSKLGVLPEEIVFIDDRQVNVDGAKSVGINSILYKNFDQLKSDLDKVL